MGPMIVFAFLATIVGTIVSGNFIVGIVNGVVLTLIIYLPYTHIKKSIQRKQEKNHEKN